MKEYRMGPNDKTFRDACEAANIPATARQWSKWQRGIGSAAFAADRASRHPLAARIAALPDNPDNVRGSGLVRWSTEPRGTWYGRRGHKS